MFSPTAIHISVTIFIIFLDNEKQAFAEKSILYLDYDYDQPNQTFVEQAIEMYPNYRSLHHQPDLVSVVIFFCNEIAVRANSTLMSVWNIDKEAVYNLNYPTICPTRRVQFSQGSEKTLWNRYRDQRNASTGEIIALPNFFQMDHFLENFVYCEVPKRSKDSKLAFLSVFVYPLDNWSWMGLFVSSALVFLAISLRSGFKLEVGQLFFALLSILVSPVLNGVGSWQKHLHSKLLVLWMLCCLVLVNMYCAVMTTNLTRPLPDKRMRSLEDLLEGRISIIYSKQKWIDHDTKIALSENRTTFINLLEIAIVHEDYLSELCFGERRTFFQTWFNCLRIAMLAQEKIVEANKGELELRNLKKCYVGHDLVDKGVFFFAFLPPSHEKVSKVFQRFFECGIYRRWINEYFATAHSARVQDRVRVVSTVKVLEEFNGDGVPSIGLNSKMVVVFELWFACLVVAFVVFVVEGRIEVKMFVCRNAVEVH